MVCGQCPPYISDDIQSQVELLSANTSVWHDGVIEAGITPVNSFSNGISQVGVTQSTATKDGTSEIGTSEIGIVEADLFQVGISQNSTSQIGFPQVVIHFSPSQIGVGQIGIMQDRPTQFSTSQIDVGQIGTFETNRFQYSPSQIGSVQVTTHHIGVIKSSEPKINSTQVGIDQWISNANPFKVSLPSGISSQQFFGGNVNSGVSFNEGFNNQPVIIHNGLSNIFSSLYSTAQNLWQTTTPIDLNFEIANLPTGQLAEANITGYDTKGRPNAATISIVDDANGVSWFIDTTPIVGKTINYTFADNGIYPVKLNVIDNNGVITTQSVNVTVNNVAPTIGSLSKPTTIKEG